MNIRVGIGLILVFYGVLNLFIEFSPVVTAIFQKTISLIPWTPATDTLSELFVPFGNSMLVSVTWFLLWIFIGLIFVFYRHLVARENGSWSRLPENLPRNKL